MCPLPVDPANPHKCSFSYRFSDFTAIPCSWNKSGKLKIFLYPFVSTGTNVCERASVRNQATRSRSRYRFTTNGPSWTTMNWRLWKIDARALIIVFIVAKVSADGNIYAANEKRPVLM
jgi:hypothetical protein